ncbi:hypothetical protein LINGRAHAP2_LOCUS13542 [Linum grandiflorum]
MQRRVVEQGGDGWLNKVVSGGWRRRRQVVEEGGVGWLKKAVLGGFEPAAETVKGRKHDCSVLFTTDRHIRDPAAEMADLDVEAMARELRTMALLADDGEIAIPEDLADVLTDDLKLYAVGTFVMDKNINFSAMHTQMANLWRPREGVTITDKGEGLILFCFYHPLDKDLVLEGGPWTFDQNLLALCSLTPGDDFTQVSLHEVDFWVLIYGLTAKFYSEVVGKALRNFIGRFVLYDDTNQYTDEDSYMRIRVTLDVRQSLVREKPVKKPSSEVVAVFKYEKRPIFCFLCGRIGHIDRACEVRFRLPRNKILPLLWDASFCAPPRKTLRQIPSLWLIPTPAERRVTILRNGGTEKGTLRSEGQQRPANIQALMPNFRTGWTRGNCSGTRILPKGPTDEQPLQLLEDTKRARGSNGHDSAMEVDKENMHAPIMEGRQRSSAWIRNGEAATASSHP